MVYMVSYDLNHPETRGDYGELIAQLEVMGFQRLLYSQWVVRWTPANSSAAVIRDILRPYIDPNDRLLVTCLDNADWAGLNLMVDPNTLA